MKIFSNISGGLKLLTCLKYLEAGKKGIAAARAAGDKDEERRHILQSTSFWGPRVLEIFGSNLTVHGSANLPEKGPVVFIGNHQGYADIFAYCAALTNFQFAFVAKKELSKIPFYGKWIARIRSVFMERDDSHAALAAIKKGIEYIEQGFSLAIFPEGTRSKGPEPGAFMKGAAKLATVPGVPIVPITVNGTYKMFEEKGYLKGADIDLVISPPLETKNLSRTEERRIMDKVEEIIKGNLKELQER